MENKAFANSELVGDFVTISLPGFPMRNGSKPEKCKIHCYMAGEGEPLLLCHSIAQSMYTYRDLIPELSKHYRVIAFDWPGFGHSDRPISLNYSMDEMADCLLMFLDAIGISETHAMGFSFGALWMLLAATKRPESFFKLITVTPGGVTRNMPRKLRNMEKPFIGPFVRESYSKAYFVKQLKTCYLDSTICDKLVAEQYFDTCDDFASRQAIMYSLRNFDEEYALFAAKKLKGEVLVLWGGEDRWRPISDMEKLRPSLAHGVYYAVRSGGHLVHEEKPALISDIMTRYIDYEGDSDA